MSRRVCGTKLEEDLMLHAGGLNCPVSLGRRCCLLRCRLWLRSLEQQDVWLCANQQGGVRRNDSCARAWVDEAIHHGTDDMNPWRQRYDCKKGAREEGNKPGV